MKTLILLLMIALGVAGVLFCRINLNMSWNDLSVAIHGFLPIALTIGTILVVMAGTVIYIARTGRSE